MKNTATALKQESQMSKSKAQEKPAAASPAGHVRKIQPNKSAAPTANDPGCRPVGT